MMTSYSAPGPKRPCPSSPSSSPADLPEVLAVVGAGQPLWHHLTGGQERAALRASSRALRDLADPLVTRVSHLVLGQAPDDNGPGSLHPLPAYLMGAWPQGEEWPVSADEVPRVKSFLSRLRQVEEVVVLVGKRGASQLERLLEQQAFPRTVRQLVVSAVRHDTVWLATADLARGLSTYLPNLQHLQLENVAITPGFFPSLAACKTLRSLQVDSQDSRMEDVTLLAVQQQLSSLTQLTKLVLDEPNLDPCSTHCIQKLTGLKCLKLKPNVVSLVETELQPLTCLTAVEQLGLDFVHCGVDELTTVEVMAILRQLPALNHLVLSNFGLYEFTWHGGLDLLHLTHLELWHLDDDRPPHIQELLAEGSLPALHTLCLPSRVHIQDLLVVMRAAPSLRTLSIPKIGYSDDTTAATIHKLACQVADVGGVLGADGNSTPLYLKHADEYSRLLPPELILALQPLSRLPAPKLKFDKRTEWNSTAVRALVAAVPNLHTLLGVAVDSNDLLRLTALQHLHSLSLTSPLDASGLHVLSVMHLTRLELAYPEQGFLLAPWPGPAASPTLRKLRVLELSFSKWMGFPYHPKDLHHLLHAAPMLKQLITTGMALLLPPPQDSSEANTTEVGLLLQEMLHRLVQLSFCTRCAGLGGLRKAPDLKLDFDCHQYSNPARLFQALSPLRRWQGLRLVLRNLSSFPPAVAKALMQAVPEVQELKLDCCQNVDGTALMALVPGLKRLRSLELHKCTGLEASSIMVVQLLVPRVKIYVSICDWWDSSNDTALQRTMMLYWRAQLMG